VRCPWRDGERTPARSGDSALRGVFGRCLSLLRREGPKEIRRQIPSPPRACIKKNIWLGRGGAAAQKLRKGPCQQRTRRQDRKERQLPESYKTGSPEFRRYQQNPDIAADQESFLQLLASRVFFLHNKKQRALEQQALFDQDDFGAEVGLITQDADSCQLAAAVSLEEVTVEAMSVPSRNMLLRNGKGTRGQTVAHGRRRDHHLERAAATLLKVVWKTVVLSSLGVRQYPATRPQANASGSAGKQTGNKGLTP